MLYSSTLTPHYILLPFNSNRKQPYSDVWTLTVVTLVNKQYPSNGFYLPCILVFQLSFRRQFIHVIILCTDNVVNYH